MPYRCIVFALAFASLLSGEILQKKSQTDGAFRYRSAAHGFSINLPSRWEIDERRPGIVLMAIRPSDGPGDKFRENVSVMIETIPNGMPLNDFLKRSVSGLKTNLSAFYLQEQGVLKLGRGVGGWIVYGYEIENRPIKVYQIFILMPGTAYTLTGAADPVRFSKYRPIFQVIAESFNAK